MAMHDSQSQTKVVHPGEDNADRPYRPAEADHDDSRRGYREPGRPAGGGEAALTVSSVASALVFLAGVWLVLAPYALNYSTARSDFDGFRNDAVIGVAIGLVALVRAATPARSAAFGLANVGLGAWLIAAPWVLDYNAGIDAPRATWNDIVVGIVVAVLAMVSMGSGLFGRSSGRAAGRAG